MALLAAEVQALIEIVKEVNSRIDGMEEDRSQEFVSSTSPGSKRIVSIGSGRSKRKAV